MIACEKGHEEVVRVLVEEGGADVNKADKNGKTPCYIAAQKGHVDVIRLLVDLVADIDKPNKYGWTPCHIAALNGHVDVIRMLVECGADLTKPDKYIHTPLIIAFQRKHTHLLPIFRHTYSHLTTPPTLTSYPNHNIFSHSRITHADYLLYVFCHRMSSVDIEGYMDVCGVVRNGMRELVEKYPDVLRLERLKKRTCGFRINIRHRKKITTECCMDLLFWESEGGYKV